MEAGDVADADADDAVAPVDHTASSSAPAPVIPTPSSPLPASGKKGEEEEAAPAPLEQKVTMIIATSPIRSNPSTAMLELTLRSIRLCCEGTKGLRKIIVCDGYSLVSDAGTVGVARGGRRISDEEAENYSEYIRRLQLLCKSDNPNFANSETLVLSSMHGFGLAVKQALKTVKSPYVFMAQHDRVFTGPATCLRQLVALLDSAPHINYLGFLSTAQKNYVRTVHSNHHIDVPIENVRGLKIVPLLGFLDSMHLARVSLWHYMFDSGKIKRRDFPEATFGVMQRLDIKSNGMKAFAKYGTYLLYDGNICVKHINGRRFWDQKQRVEKGYPEKGEVWQLSQMLDKMEITLRERRKCVTREDLKQDVPTDSAVNKNRK